MISGTEFEREITIRFRIRKIEERNVQSLASEVKPEVIKQAKAIPVAARCKGGSAAIALAGIGGSNPGGRHGRLYLVSVMCYTGRGLSDRPIPCPGESLSVIRCDNNPLHLHSVTGRSLVQGSH